MPQLTGLGGREGAAKLPRPREKKDLPLLPTLVVVAVTSVVGASREDSKREDTSLPDPLPTGSTTPLNTPEAPAEEPLPSPAAADVAERCLGGRG